MAQPKPAITMHRGARQADLPLPASVQAQLSPHPLRHQIRPSQSTASLSEPIYRYETKRVPTEQPAASQSPVAQYLETEMGDGRSSESSITISVFPSAQISAVVAVESIRTEHPAPGITLDLVHVRLRNPNQRPFSLSNQYLWPNKSTHQLYT